MNRRKTKLRIFLLVLVPISILAVVCLSKIDLAPPVAYFYIDKTGKKVLDGPGYYGDSFHEGLALVCEEYHVTAREQRIKYIDRGGNTIIGLRVQQASPFSEGLAAIRIKVSDKTKGLVGYIDKKGKWVIPPQYRRGETFSDGVALVVTKDGRSQYIDHAGKVILDMGEKFPDVKFWVSYSKYWLMSFSEGVAGARFNSEWGYIDKTANWVIAPHMLKQLQGMSPFCDGLAYVMTVDDNGYYIDKTGSKQISRKFWWRGDFSEGCAPVSMNGFYGYIDCSGKFVIEPQYAYGGDFCCGMADVVPFVRVKMV